LFATGENKMSLQDQMSVAADAARKAKRNIKAAKERARRATKKAAAEMNAEVATERSTRKGRRKGQRVNVRANADTASAAITAKVVPVKVTVKQAVLDLFYAAPNTVFSTKEAVATIQAAHAGMNESSIRVWISDFQKDGSIKLVKRDGRQVILKAGKLGTR
jgi:hypothetical protein